MVFEILVKNKYHVYMSCSCCSSTKNFKIPYSNKFLSIIPESIYLMIETQKCSYGIEILNEFQLRERKKEMEHQMLLLEMSFS